MVFMDHFGCDYCSRSYGHVFLLILKKIKIDIWLMYVVAPLDHFGWDHHLRSNGCVVTFEFFLKMDI